MEFSCISNKSRIIFLKCFCFKICLSFILKSVEAFAKNNISTTLNALSFSVKKQTLKKKPNKAKQSQFSVFIDINKTKPSDWLQPQVQYRPFKMDSLWISQQSQQLALLCWSQFASVCLRMLFSNFLLLPIYSSGPPPSPACQDAGGSVLLSRC